MFELSEPVKRRVKLADTLPTEHPPILDEVAGLLDRLPDPEWLMAEERVGSVTAVTVLRNRLDAYLTALAGACHEHADSVLLGAGTTGMLMAVASGQNPATGSAIVARSRALRRLPDLAQAFAQGQVSAVHVGHIVADADRVDDFAELEEQVVNVARCAEPAATRRLMKQLVDASAPDGLDGDHEKARDKRGISLSQTSGGMWRLDGYLDPISGRRISDALAPLMDRAGTDDLRTPRQRRADALSDLVAAGAANRRPLGVSQVSVLVDLDSLIEGVAGMLDDATPLGAGLFDLLSCTPEISIIYGRRLRGGFVPLALGRTRRRASYAQWQALIARDRGCLRCGRAPRYCEAHHIIGWACGGDTDLQNLVLLCSRCHHDLHLGHYNITMTNGSPEIAFNHLRAPPRSA